MTNKILEFIAQETNGFIRITEMMWFRKEQNSIN